MECPFVLTAVPNIGLPQVFAALAGLPFSLHRALKAALALMLERDTHGIALPHFPEARSVYDGSIRWAVPVLLVLHHLEAISGPYPSRGVQDKVVADDDNGGKGQQGVGQPQQLEPTPQLPEEKRSKNAGPTEMQAGHRRVGIVKPGQFRAAVVK